MGRSAKVHKRVKKGKSSSSHPNPTPASTSVPKPAAAAPSVPPPVKRRANLKAKLETASGDTNNEGPVLGGADYVALMMGGRKKAKADADKLADMDED